MTLQEIIANQTFLEWIDYDNERAEDYYRWYNNGHGDIALMEERLI